MWPSERGRRVASVYGWICLVLAVASPATAAADSGELARRAFTDSQDRVQKFQDPDRIFPSRAVSPAADPLPLPRADLPDGFAIRYEWRGETYDVDEFNERTRTTALLILKDGRIVTEIYRNGARPETRFISFSTGKSVTSTLLGMAIADGYVGSVDEPLTQYLPALTGSAYDGVTIRDALQMSSGVAWDEYEYDFGNLAKPLNRHWENAMVQQRYRFVEGANELPREYEPGKKFNYNTLETCLLGWLVENATKRRLSTYMQQRLWQPAGMEFEARWLLDGPEGIGREMSGGMLEAALRDYGRFGLLIMNGGKAGDRQLVPADWVRAATSAGSDAVSYGKLYEGYPLGYGYQWWLFPDGNFEAQGIFGQLIFVAPAERVVIVKLSAWPEAWVDDMEFESYAFFDAVVDALRD